LLPVLRQLAAAGYPLWPLAYRQALPLWREAGLAAQALPETAGTALDWPALLATFAGTVGEAAAPRLLLTATSVNGLDWESALWSQARAAGVPSLAVLDFWSNLPPRFQHRGQPAWPTHLAVMDAAVAAELRALFPGAGPALHVTGQPVFDPLPALAARAGEVVPPLRQALGLAAGERLVLFVSQPLAELRRQPGFADWGFDQHQVLAGLLPALAARASQHGEKLCLVLRPHPREADAGLRPYLEQAFPGLRLQLERQLPGPALALAADLVCGMNSVLLQEAAYLGRPVLSLQPGLSQPDPLPANRQGLSQLVRTWADLPAALVAALTPGRPAPAVELLPDGHATARIAELAQQVLSGTIHV
jgi:hypothetical protein